MIVFLSSTRIHTHTHTHTHTASSLIWNPKSMGMAVGRDLVEGVVSTLFKRVQIEAASAKPSTGLGARP